MSIELIDRTLAMRARGQADDAVALLATAVSEQPGELVLLPFLALALLDAGHPKAALATLLGALLDAAPAGSLAGYEEALGEQHALLLESATTR